MSFKRIIILMFILFLILSSGGGKLIKGSPIITPMSGSSSENFYYRITLEDNIRIDGPIQLIGTVLKGNKYVEVFRWNNLEVNSDNIIRKDLDKSELSREFFVGEIKNTLIIGSNSESFTGPKILYNYKNIIANRDMRQFSAEVRSLNPTSFVLFCTYDSEWTDTANLTPDKIEDLDDGWKSLLWNLDPLPTNCKISPEKKR